MGALFGIRVGKLNINKNPFKDWCIFVREGLLEEGHLIESLLYTDSPE